MYLYVRRCKSSYKLTVMYSYVGGCPLMSGDVGKARHQSRWNECLAETPKAPEETREALMGACLSSLVLMDGGHGNGGKNMIRHILWPSESLPFYRGRLCVSMIKTSRPIVIGWTVPTIAAPPQKNLQRSPERGTSCPPCRRETCM